MKGGLRKELKLDENSHLCAFCLYCCYSAAVTKFLSQALEQPHSIFLGPEFVVCFMDILQVQAAVHLVMLSCARLLMEYSAQLCLGEAGGGRDGASEVNFLSIRLCLLCTGVEPLLVVISSWMKLLNCNKNTISSSCKSFV